MLITRSNVWQEGIRKRTLKKTLSLGPISLKIVIIFIFVAVALFYLAQSTQSAGRNFKLQELEQEKHNAENEKETLEVEAVRLRSLGEVRNQAQNVGLQPPP